MWASWVPAHHHSSASGFFFSIDNHHHQFPAVARGPTGYEALTSSAAESRSVPSDRRNLKPSTASIFKFLTLQSNFAKFSRNSSSSNLRSFTIAKCPFGSTVLEATYGTNLQIPHRAVEILQNIREIRHHRPPTFATHSRKLKSKPTSGQFSRTKRGKQAQSNPICFSTHRQHLPLHPSSPPS
jgi:hypothetical protein